MAVTVKQEVAALYSAIFNRAPDQAGLEFWVNAIEGGDSLVQAAEGFTQHPVFAETYAGMSDSQFVQQLYVNILGGAGDANGIAFWTEKLASGVSKGQVVAEFVQGALSIDLDALLASGELSQAEYDAAVARQDSLTNKANVGLHFVEKFGAATNLSADTDTTTKEGLESDPVYLASQAAIANVTADAASVTAANAAINAAGAPTDLNVAPAFTLTNGLETLSAANQAKVDFLASLELDLNDDDIVDVEAGDATKDDVATDLTNAIAAVDALVAGDYTNASVNVKAALLADEQEANAKALSDAQKALATAEAEIAKVTGLAQAIATLQSAEDALTAAEGAEKTASAAQDGAEVSYEALNTAITIEADGQVAGLIELVNGKLQLVSGVTETTNEGVTSLLAAIKTHLAAQAATENAQDARLAAQEVVDNLDLSTTAKADLSAVALEMGLEADAAPSVAAIETEITGRVAELKTAAASSNFDVTQTGTVNVNDGVTAVETQALLNAANLVVTNLQTAAGIASGDLEAYAFVGAGAADNLSEAEVAAAQTALQNGLSALNAAIGQIAFANNDADTIAALETLTAEAVLDGFISADDKLAIDSAFAAEDSDAADGDTTDDFAGADLDAAIAAAQTALTANSNSNEFAADVTAYQNALAPIADAQATADAAKELDDLVGAYATYTDSADTNDRLDDLEDAQQAVKDAQNGIDSLAEALANLAAAQANADQLDSLNDTIAAAEKAFTDNGFEVPVTVDGVELATADADIFMVGEVGGSITNFGLLGDDVLFVSGATYNSAVIGSDDGEVALKTAGNNSVQEFFLEETATGVKVMVETSAFGSSAATPEVTTIELSGLKLADLSVEGGFITLA